MGLLKLPQALGKSRSCHSWVLHSSRFFIHIFDTDPVPIHVVAWTEYAVLTTVKVLGELFCKILGVIKLVEQFSHSKLDIVPPSLRNVKLC